MEGELGIIFGRMFLAVLAGVVISAVTVGVLSRTGAFMWVRGVIAQAQGGDYLSEQGPGFVHPRNFQGN